MLCVRPGVFDVLAKLFLCNKELISDDFPTLERPKNAISRLPSVGHCPARNALFTNSAEVIFTLFNRRRNVRCAGFGLPDLRCFETVDLDIAFECEF